MTEGEGLFEEVPQAEGAMRKAETTPTLGFCARGDAQPGAS